ncbi:MAG TPA: amidohydrolase family protein [Thermoanaerobaculia bacterium]|nr:amidohydrolase family protein [Thermoanaerobaculia bacterium]
MRLPLLSLALFASLSSLSSLSSHAAAQAPPTAIEHVRLFDGETVLDDATVLLLDGRIERVGPAAEIAVPADAERVDGRGRTLLPGLIDAHVHAFGDALERALEWGVTTVLDMFTDAGLARTLREEQARGEATDRADLFSAGTLVTAKGGHGTQFGLPIPTLERAEDAAVFVADRVAEGSDYLKIVIEDGSVIERSIPTLDRARVEGVVDAAHQHDKLAVAHASTLDGARMALEAGVDGLVHLHHDGEHTAEEEAAVVALARERGVFVVPTLTVLEGLAGGEGATALAESPALAERLTEAQRQGLRSSFGRGGGEEGRRAFERILARAAAMETAGVPVLAGTDAPNPGTAYGVSLHRELELLVRAGLDPAGALAAATARTARAFGLADRGMIAAGVKADLLLVEGDPTTEITATRDIIAVWKDGVRHEPPVHGAPEATSGLPRIEPGPFGTFDDGTLDAPYGTWMPSTDQMAGGKSTVELELVAPGADGSAGALEMRGELAAGFAFPWSGALFGPGDMPMTDAVDASAAGRLTFWARSPDGEARIAVMLFARSFGPVPRQEPIELTPEWQRFEIPFETFGTEGADLTGLVFSAAALGAFRVQLDQVALE